MEAETMKFNHKYLDEQWAHYETQRWLSTVRKYAVLSKYTNALDIGTGGGLSANIVLLAGKGKVTTVDIKDRPKVESVAKDLKLTKRLTVFKNGERPDEKYDLIIVDGDHFYESVVADLNYAWAHMDKGYIVCDDYDRYPKHVGRAVDIFAKQHPDCVLENGRAIFKR